jgi:hypothetical protein
MISKLKTAIAICLVALAMRAAAQTVTGSGTSGYVPVYIGTSSPSSAIGQSLIFSSDWNGYVGIGTSAPAATLQVGNGGATNALYINSNLGGNPVIAPYGGVWIEWNGAPEGNGVTSFVNNEGSGTGGWEFDNTNSSGTLLSTPMVIQGGGNVGIGTTAPAYNLDVAGVARAQAGIIYPDGNKQTTAWTGVLCGGDYAEAVNAKGSRKIYEPGDVLVIGDGAEGEVQKSAEPYSTMVAGIFATKPGVIGRRQSLLKEDEEIPMAMIGIVPTKVTAENGPIHRGDLLVTSSATGYAMKGTDRSRLVGAVIGKALGSLETGTGVIEVLVTLQ